MLTKELIACRIEGGRVKPLFLKDSPNWLDLAARMIELYPEPGNATRGDIDEALDRLEDGADDLRTVRMFRKILEDRTEYEAVAEIDYAAERRKVFLAATELLRQNNELDEQHYREAALAQAHSDLQPRRLYADLPVNDRFLKLKLTGGARELLERVNVGIVQALLLQADSLELELEDAAPARLRRLLTQARFHRLIVEATACPVRRADPSGIQRQAVRLVVDGPGSVLEQSRSYGLQLATFFPSICAMEKWDLKAMVRWKNAIRRLHLDQTSGLVCHQSTGAFVPREVEMFRMHFQNTAHDWKLLEDIPLLKTKNGRLLVPDFAFGSPAGRQVFLELFHRGRGTHLLERLAQLEQGADWPLALGVDRAVAAQPEVQEALAASEYFAVHGFLYRDYPTVEKTLKTLASLALFR